MYHLILVLCTHECHQHKRVMISGGTDDDDDDSNKNIVTFIILTKLL